MMRKDGWRIKLAKDIKKISPRVFAEFITQSGSINFRPIYIYQSIIRQEIEEDIIQADSRCTIQH